MDGAFGLPYVTRDRKTLLDQPGSNAVPTVPGDECETVGYSGGA